MTAYLLKFVLCSGLLLLVYRTFLGSERLYRFNRFYLLFSLVFSLMVPAITIHVPYMGMPVWDAFLDSRPSAVNLPPTTQSGISSTIQFKTKGKARYQPTNEAQQNGINQLIAKQPVYTKATKTPVHRKSARAPETQHHYLPAILLALYGLGVLLLSIRFIRNGYHISRLIHKSTVVNYQDVKLVLVADDVTPHSFLKYIFLNHYAYYNKTIEPEIICHEQAHVRQLHSLDVIWIELLQILGWFNPFIPFYRKAIQLNHEFLADEAVIENYQDTAAYQYLLLAKVSQQGSLYLTSQFNYLVTKKRIIMMTKSTTTAALYKRLALLPVLAAALFLFSQKIMAHNRPKVKPVGNAPAIKKAAPKSQAGTAIKTTIQGAPQNIIDEYTAILKKYNFPPDIAKLKQIATPPYPKHKILGPPNFSKEDRERLLALFKQMSRQQQQQQWLIFIKGGLPLPKVSASESQLNSWKNPKEYGVWINDKKVNNAELNKYKATDFDHVFVSKLTSAALHHTEYHYQVDLMTKAYYARYYKETKAKGSIYYAMPHIPGINSKVKKHQKAVSIVMPKKADDKSTEHPLIVFDGVPYDKPLPDNFFANGADDAKLVSLIAIQPSQVKGVVVLKDEAATKAWGDRGANGVIEINTNREAK